MGLGDPGHVRIAVLALLASAVTGLGLASVAKLAISRALRRPVPRGTRRAAWVFVGLTLLEVACLAWAWLVEPRWVEVTFHEVSAPRLARGQRLRIVQISDLHLEPAGPPALAGLAERVAALSPDLVVFTGDLASDEAGLASLRGWMEQIPAPLGRYSVRGNHEAWLSPSARPLGDAAVELLDGTPRDLPGVPVSLCGATQGYPERLADCLSRTGGRMRVVLYHTPDLVEVLAPLGPDLYLAGHTHGGQVRVPFYGALVTLSRFDKKYEAGRYQVGSTVLYVSRGLGFEPRPAPPLRFACRAEVVVLDLVGGAPE